VSRFRKIDPFADVANAPHRPHDDARYDVGAIDDDLAPIPEPLRKPDEPEEPGGPDAQPAVVDGGDPGGPADGQAIINAIARLQRSIDDSQRSASEEVADVLARLDALSQRQRADLERVVHHLDTTSATLAERQADRYEASAVQVLGRIEQVAATLRLGPSAGAAGSTDLAVGGSAPMPDVEGIGEMLNAVRWDTRRGTDAVVARLDVLQRIVTEEGGRRSPSDEADDRPAVGMVGAAWFARVERTLESLSATSAAATAAAITAMGEQQRVDLERVLKRIDSTGSIVERQGARHDATSAQVLDRIADIAEALERQAAAAADDGARETSDAILERLDEILAALRQLVG